MQGKCCWPGQAWSGSRSVCVGVPTTCPAGLIPQADGCIAAPATPPAPPPQPAVVPAPVTPPRSGGEAPAAASAPTPERPISRVRVSLAGGVLAGELTGGAVALPIRIGLVTIKERASLQGTLALLVTPSLLGAMQNAFGANYFSGGIALTTAAGWHQRFGPVELFPHFGVNFGLLFRVLESRTSDWALDLAIKGVVGLNFAVPAGEGTKFIVGVQGQLGGPASQAFIWIGVEF